MRKIAAAVLIALVLGDAVLAEGSKEQPAAGDSTGFETTTLKFGTTSGETTVVVATMRAFAQKVKEKTGGKVIIEVFPSSQLGNATEIIRSTQMGAVDMCMAQPAALASMGVKDLSVLALPYIFKNFDQRMNVLFGPIGNELLDKTTSTNNQLKGFGYYPDGARSFFTVKGKPIRKIEDVKGMKLRVQALPMDTDMAVALGASPTPTATAEMYGALQTGLVDGAEQPIAAYYTNKFYEVSSYLTLDEHTYNTLVVLFSDISWKKRSPQLQKVLTESWVETVKEAKEKIVKTDEEYLIKIAEQGIEVIRLQDRPKWEESMKPLYAKYGVGFATLIAKIQLNN